MEEIEQNKMGTVPKNIGTYGYCGYQLKAWHPLRQGFIHQISIDH